MFAFGLGQKVKDKTTGHEGIITGRVEYLEGQSRYYIDANPEDNWTDEESVEALT